MRLGVEAALVRGELVPGDVDVSDGRVAAVGLADGARGRIAVPGFVDLQVNGYGGVDFATAAEEGYRRAGEALLLAGVTAYQPTFVSSPEQDTVEALRAVPLGTPGPRILGVHLEGPFLSPERAGAHRPEHLRAPDLELLDRLLDAGPVTETTLAPELPGADALVRRLRERGVAVSAGHTNATAEEASRGFALGISAVTHLFNAMRPFAARDPGVAGAALTRPGVFVTLIVDGHHLADATVRLAWACAGGRLALITDATAGAGTDAAAGGEPPRLEDGTLAGTVLTLLDAVRNLHALGVPLEEAVAAATAIPARLLGRDDVGVLEPGGAADVVVLDDRLEIRAVLCAGAEVVARS